MRTRRRRPDGPAPTPPTAEAHQEAPPRSPAAARRPPGWTTGWHDRPPGDLFVADVGLTPSASGGATTGRPADRLEQEADQVASHVAEQTGATTGPATRDRSTSVARGSGGEPLDDATRATMETTFGQDFGQVRIHADGRAAASAAALNADAYTVGQDVVFGSGRYAPATSAGRQLLAHELTHVVQQRRDAGSPALQRKLRLTGTGPHINRALAILNGGLFGWTVSVDSSGNVSMARNDTQGPPTPEQSALESQLRTIIGDSTTVTVGVGAGTATIVGSYAGATIDVADMEAFGTGPGGSAAGTMVHELVEQFERQAHGTAFGSETTGAHGAGIAAESQVVGATRGPQRVVSSSTNADGTLNAVIEIPFTHPDGTVTTVRMTIDHNNVTSVTR